MDDNTSIQFRLRLAQINGVQLTNKNSVNEGATEAQRLAGAWKRSTEPSDKIKITGVQKIPGGTKVAGSGKASIHKDAKITGVQKIPGEMKEEQIDEATIRHVLPKEQVAGHIKRVENSFGWEHGKHYHIVPLPTDHNLAKTHAGIVFKARHGRKDLEGAVNADGGRGARQVDDHYNLAKSDPQQLDNPIHVKNMKYSVNKVNEEQIDEVKRSADYLHSTATEDQRAPTLKTYHTAMAKYSNLPPRTAHINALNDTIDKHGVKNANQHVTKHFYSQMQKHLSDED